MRNDRERLLDIAESIKQIEFYAARGKEAFEADSLLQTWMVHHIQIIGEAAGKLTEPLRSAVLPRPHPRASFALSHKVLAPTSSPSRGLPRTPVSLA